MTRPQTYLTLHRTVCTHILFLLRMSSIVLGDYWKPLVMTMSLGLFKIIWTVVTDDFRTSSKFNSPTTNPNGSRTQNTILQPTYSSPNWYYVQHPHRLNSLSHIHLFFFICLFYRPVYYSLYMTGSLSFLSRHSPARLGQGLDCLRSEPCQRHAGLDQTPAIMEIYSSSLEHVVSSEYTEP